MELENGSRVGVVGGGPAGSFFSYFLLNFAEHVDLDIEVDIWEPKDFGAVGPGGCNHCGGIVSESLVQLLATEGLVIPDDVVQRGIDSYVLHTDLGRVPIAAPGGEMRIAAIHRGGGPRGSESKYGSFDGYLLMKAQEEGANVIHERVSGLSWDGDKPVVESKNGSKKTYDLLVGAAGINSAVLKNFEGLGIGYKPPTGAKTYISELHFGEEVINRYLGNSMHVFLVNFPGVEFLAIIPKGDYATLVVLGEGINREVIDRLFELPEVRGCLPPGWDKNQVGCFCMPKVNVGGAQSFWGDRVVILGDAAVSRLYKDGIGAAYKTAKALASTVVFDGVSKPAFRGLYRRACQYLDHDNRIGKLVFMTVTLFRYIRPLRRGMTRMVEREQRGHHKDMSIVLWDTFTGSAPYRDIFFRCLHPGFLARLGFESVAGMFQSKTSMKARVTS